MDQALIPDPVIVCVECGGSAHLLGHLPEDEPLEPGDFVAYRCEQCGARWDVAVSADDGPDASATPYGG